MWLSAYSKIGCISFAYFIGQCCTCIDVKWDYAFCYYFCFIFLNGCCILSWIAHESFSISQVFFRPTRTGWRGCTWARRTFPLYTWPGWALALGSWCRWLFQESVRALIHNSQTCSCQRTSCELQEWGRKTFREQAGGKTDVLLISRDTLTCRGMGLHSVIGTGGSGGPWVKRCVHLVHLHVITLVLHYG